MVSTTVSAMLEIRQRPSIPPVPVPGPDHPLYQPKAGTRETPDSEPGTSHAIDNQAHQDHQPDATEFIGASYRTLLDRTYNNSK